MLFELIMIEIVLYTTTLYTQHPTKTVNLFTLPVLLFNNEVIVAAIFQSLPTNFRHRYQLKYLYFHIR